MKMYDRLTDLIENSQREIEDIDMRIAGFEEDIARLRTRRLLIEEEGVEARVALNFLQFHNVKVERGEDGILIASADPVEQEARAAS